MATARLLFRTRFLIPIAFVCALSLAACGGGGGLGFTSTGSTDVWPAHGWADSVRSGSYAVVAVDNEDQVLPELTRALRLEILPGADGATAVISADALPACSGIGLHLKYDAATMHPGEARCAPGLKERTLFLSVTSQPGAVALGLATMGGAATLTGKLELARVDFARGACDRMRALSSLNTTPVTDLHWDGTDPQLLVWSYNAPGDTDQNSIVSITDLSPIGAHFGKNSSASDWSYAQVADADRNLIVSVADLVPLAIHFNERVTGYQVLDCATETGQYNAVSGAFVDFSAGTIPVGGGFKQFSYQLTAPVDGNWYSVIAQEETTFAADHSNAIQYLTGAELPPRNLTGTSNETNILLSWTAPASGTPDGYHVFVSTFPEMSSAMQVNSMIITDLNYTVPEGFFPPTNPYYFGVVAEYGGTNSEYSNIFHYIPGGDAPQNLIAAQVGDHIQLTWEVPLTGTPDGYNAYISTDAAMSSPQKMNGSTPITGLTYDVNNGFFPPTNPYYFAVKASTGGSESVYSNIYYYDPAAGPDTDPPVWQGDPGILTVAPDDGLVAITWSAAIDAQTPPVEYLLYYVEDTQEIDWNSPVEVYAAGITTANVIGLTNGTRYKFAIRAQDSVDPTPNVTTNTNYLTATPMAFPDDGPIGTVMASDVASVRMPGEELPRIAAVDHAGALYYCYYAGGAWTVTDLSPTIGDTDRKYHPQMLGIGNEVHIAYGTATGIFEIYGAKDDPPASWTLKTVATGITNTFGIGFSYSTAESYLAVIFATKSGGTEKLLYSDRDSAGNWSAPVGFMDGNPEIWQCDLALNDYDGSQWAVAANGTANSTGDDLKFYYMHRDSRTGTWVGGTTGYGGDVMVVEIDPTIHQPLVACAEVREVSVPLAGMAPCSDATIFTWDGSTWLKNVLEAGDVIFDQGNFTLTTILTGQDPQLVFSPTGKAISLWSKLNMESDMLEDYSTLTGDWRYAQRTETTWGATHSMLPHITSSNSVTAGEGYQHCVTCDIGVVDEDVTSILFDKYSTRNDYVEGELYYHRQTW